MLHACYHDRDPVGLGGASRSRAPPAGLPRLMKRLFGISLVSFYTIGPIRPITRLLLRPIFYCSLRPALYDAASRLIDYCYEPTPTDSAIVRRLTSLVELRRLGVYARQNVSGSAYISLRLVWRLLSPQFVPRRMTRHQVTH